MGNQVHGMRFRATSSVTFVCWAAASLAASCSSTPAEPEVATGQVTQTVCTSPLTLVATPANSGFETDVNGDGIPDGWTRAGVGNTEIIDPGYDGKSIKLSAFSAGANIYIDTRWTTARRRLRVCMGRMRTQSRGRLGVRPGTPRPSSRGSEIRRPHNAA
jgi:hypothetical protein